MKRKAVLVLVAGILGVACACGPRETVEQRHQEANTPAGKAGQAAHKVAVEADKAGRAVRRQLNRAAHDAHEGWKEDAQKDKARQ